LLQYWATAVLGLVVLVLVVMVVGFGLTVVNTVWLNMRETFASVMPGSSVYFDRTDEALGYLWTALKIVPLFIAASLLIYIIVNAQRRDRYEELYG
jgi:hypothetical protein